ncbi:myb-binding protein 1A [Anopheles ziemanni]|uniref:myb-binding protein 1A n=1 Tax=Anopheles coustani TaxID=139045 RepID=UPI00265A56F1|nr:myb-binding protein 1A [Anopheles coustani]XP_058174667.1 myb-binding protein 1A [Anopheles ziemanni]
MKEEPGRKAAGKLDKTVFGFFNSFVDTDDEARVRGATDLIEFLSQDDVPQQNGKDGTTNGTAPKTAETAYALKRLIRGVGSTSNASRAGFYTALVGLLSQLKGKEDCPSITELFVLVKSELSNSEKPTDDEENKKLRLELRIGKVLVCGAIIKAGLIESATDMELTSIFKTLRKGMYKMLTPLVYTFLNELVPQIDAIRFKLFWPQFEAVLNVPKEQHTIDSTFFLLLLSTGAHHKLVNKKYFERNFGAPKLLHPDAFPHLSGVLFNIRTLMEINHPFYDCLLEKLIKTGLLVQFVADAIVPILEQDEKSRPKFRDIVVLRVFISFLGRLDDYSCVPELLHPSLVKFLLQNFKNLSDYSGDVRELHQEACKALIECYPKMVEEKDRLATFRRLTQAPSSILIEKYASCKLLQNLLATLSTESLKSIGSELKALILDESTATNSERSYAAQMLQRLYLLRQFTSDTKDKHQADEQRLEVVRFFLTLGVFYSSDGVNVLKSSKHDGAISQELATTVRGLFFHSLDHRHAELAHERDFLFAIVRHVHETLQAHGGAKSLRTPLTDEQMSCWNRMYATVVASGEGTKESKKRSTTKDGKKLDTVFHILLMHMGLHLFSDPELAASSIVELECVMKRIGGKGKKKRRHSVANGGSTNDNDDEEPEWIEVVVDLFLNLLSQNSHLLRNVINHVFPHLSEELTLTAFNQIMSVINLKDKTNPLSAENEEADDDGADEEEEEEQESDNEGPKKAKKSKKNKDDEENDDEDDDDDDDDEDDEELMGDEEEEETISDKMRLAVQQALGRANPETDTESVDLDEMDEEQGRKLDAALSEAFRAFRQAKSSNKKKGPTKVEQQIDTVLTHFRMRVFDLIDAYLKHEPDMIICLELMLYVFEMLPIAMREGSKYGAILNRYKQIFNTLVRIKEFRQNAQDVGAEQLNQILRDLIDKVAKGVAFPERNMYLLKACQFIVLCSQMLESHDRKEKQNGRETLQVDTIFGDLLADILTNRNPPIALNMFQTIFRMPWTGNWHLAVRVATGGLKVGSIRGIRRIQVLQLVRGLLHNRRFVSLDLPLAKQSLATICNDAVAPYVAELKGAISGGDRSIGQNELLELLQLLLEIHRLQPQLEAGAVVSKKLQKQQKTHQLLHWETIGQHVQAMRRFTLSSQTMSCYRQLCNRLGLTPIGNGDILEVEANGDSSTRTPDIPTINGVSEKQKKKKKGMGKGQQQTEDESIQLNGHAINGHDDNGDDVDDIEEEANADEAPEPQVNGLKRKRSKAQAAHNSNDEHTSDNTKKEKRRKKEARLQSASLGLEGVSFAKAL